MEREHVAENTSCQLSAANWSALAVSRETTSPTPKNQQLGNYIIARKTWKVDMDFKRQKKGGWSSLNKATAKDKEGTLFEFTEGSTVTPTSRSSGTMSGHCHVAASDLEQWLSLSVPQCLPLYSEGDKIEPTSEGGCEDSCMVA